MGDIKHLAEIPECVCGIKNVKVIVFKDGIIKCPKCKKLLVIMKWGERLRTFAGKSVSIP